MMVFLIGGAVLILCGLFFFWLALRSRNPENLVETVGTLTRRQHFRDAQVKGYRVNNLTDYTYCYTVGGKTYKLSGTQWSHPRKLLPKTTIVYLKGFPHLAEIGTFTGTPEQLLGGAFCILGLLCLWVSAQVS